MRHATGAESRGMLGNIMIAALTLLATPAAAGWTCRAFLAAAP